MVVEVGIAATAGVVEGAIDGYFFNKKVDKLGVAIEKLMATAHERSKSLMADGFSGLTLQQIEFFNHVDLSLQGLKNIYETEMNLTVEKVDKKAQAILATVDKMVHHCTRELLSPQMQELAYAARATVHSLPFVSDKPILTAFFPVFVAPTRHADILIKCVGKFPALPESKTTPTLHFNERTYHSISNQPEIRFSVPLHDLFPLGGNSVHGIRKASFDVEIPFESTSLLSYVLPSETSYHYQGSIYLLPEFPGRITIHYTKLRMEEKHEVIKSPNIIQNSRDSNGGEGRSIINRIHTLKTKAGWKIVPGTVHFNILENKGERSKWELHQVTSEQATYHVTTRRYSIGHKNYNHCGKIIFNISATISQSYPVVEKTKEEHFLKWGESIIIDESKGNWEIHFDSFDGLHNEIPGYGVSKFLRVQSFGGKPVLTIDPPEQVTSHFLLSNNPAASG